MTEHIKQIIEFLQKTIDDAVSRLTGKASSNRANEPPSASQRI